MEGWNYAFVLAVFCSISWMPTQVTQAQSYTITRTVKQTNTGAEDTGWRSMQVENSFFGYTIISSTTTTNAPIRIDNVTVIAGPCSGATTVSCDFNSGYCGYRNDRCSDQINYEINSGILETVGTGEAILVLAPADTSSPEHPQRCIKFEYLTPVAADEIRVVDAYPLTTGINALKTQSSILKTTDYFCNFDGGNNHCYWDIEEPDSNVYVECKAGGTTGALTVDQTYGNDNTNGKYLNLGWTSSATVNSTVSILGPASAGDANGICFSMFYYINETGPSDLIKVEYEPAAGGAHTMVQSFGTSTDGQWKYTSFNIPSATDFRVVITLKYSGAAIGVDNLRLYAKTAGGNLQCGDAMTKSSIEIGGLDCRFKSTETRTDTPGNEVVATDDMCLWSNNQENANWKVATTGADSYLESGGNGVAELSSTAFPVVALSATDDKRLRCFTMSYHNLGTMSVKAENRTVWTTSTMTSFTDVASMASLELGIVLQSTSTAVIAVDASAQGSIIDNLQLQTQACGCAFDAATAATIFCGWTHPTSLWAVQGATSNADAHTCTSPPQVGAAASPIETTKSFGPAVTGRCVRFSYKKATGTDATFGLSLVVGGVTKPLMNTTTATGAGVWITYLVSYVEAQPHELKFVYEKASASTSETICLNNLVFADEECSIIGCNAGEFEGAVHDTGSANVSQCEKCDFGTYSTEPGLKSCTDCDNKDRNSTVDKGANNPSLCAGICGVGLTKNATSGKCEPCEQHYYKDSAGDGACTICPNGRKTSGTGANSTADCKCNAGQGLDSSGMNCQDCVNGYFNAMIGGTCEQCPNMTTTLAPGANSSDACVCAPGQKFPDNTLTCVVCEPGTYQPNAEKNSTCTSCDAGFTTVNNGSTSMDHCLCMEGKFHNGSLCEDCAPGSFKAMIGNGTCDLCNATRDNTTSVETGAVNATFCGCDKGFGIGDNGTCVLCARGWYKDSVGDTNCTMCPAGRTTEMEGANHVNLCGCMAGHAPNYTDADPTNPATPCIQCDLGYYKGNIGNDNCTKCGNGTSHEAALTTINMASLSNMDCVCLEGYNTTGPEMCGECENGTYAASKNSSMCTPCPPFSSTLMPRSTNVTDCKCQMGYGADNVTGDCRACAPGWYKDTVDNTICTMCAMGRSTANNASVTSTDCQCEAGHYPDPSDPTNDTAACLMCPTGYFKSSPGNANCTECGNSTSMQSALTTVIMGARSNVDCVCLEGYQGNGTEMCEACQLGFYASMKNSSTCEMCPPFSTSNMTKSTNVTDCICEPGYYHNGTGCIPCGFNKYKNESGNSMALCMDCSTVLTGGTTTLTDNSTNSNQCLCNMGHFDNSTGCEPCAQHSFQNMPNRNSSCNSCGDAEGRNYTAGTGATDMMNCTCNKGEFFSAMSMNCTACPENDFQDAYPMPGEPCKSCAGTKNNTGHNTTGAIDSSTCVCRPGFFNTMGGNCSECAIGAYQDMFVDNVTCASCGANRSTLMSASDSEAKCACDVGYEFNTTSSQCEPCPMGTFNDRVNGTCRACQMGEQTAGVGSSSQAQCLCGPGLFRVNDTSPCGPCGFGKYKNETGNNDTLCMSCTGGTVPDQVTTMVDNATTQDQCFCNKGYTRETDGDVTSTCTACGNGTWSGSLTNGANCTMCRANSNTSDTARTMASDCGCNPGFFDNSTDCQQCEQGRYNNLWNQTMCTVCPNGQNTAGLGSSDVSECICGPGYTRNGTNSGPCMECGFGKFKNISGNDACEMCPHAMHTTMSNISTNATDCLCQSGYSGDSMTCTECETGTYSTAPNTANCTGCSPDRNTTGPGKMMQSDCLCAAGRQEDGSGNCAKCTVGTYKESLTGNCTACANNASLTTNTTGADSFSLCICNKGYTGSAPACSECEMGKYKAMPGAQACDMCNTGSTTNVTGADSADFCQCDVGQEGNGTACVACPTGLIKDFIGGKPSDNGGSCGNCSVILGPEYSTAGSGLTHRDNCTCIPGYAKNDMNNCTKCMNGTFKNVTGDGPCTTCTDPHSTTIAEGAITEALCVCKAGFELVGSACTKCKVGHYKDMPGNENCTKCTDDKATTVLDGAISKDMCVCPPGFTGSPCAECGVGKYKNTTSNDACAMCETNRTTINANSSDINMCLCVAGRYLNSGSCDLCPAGNYSTAPNVKTMCTSCNDTQTTLQLGSTLMSQCVCNPGLYLSGSGCIGCDVGFYKTDPGNEKAKCLMCGVNATTDVAGKTASSDCVCNPGHEGSPCAPCKVGYYKPGPASNANCTMCATGKSTLNEGSIDATSSCLCDKGYQDSGNNCVKCINGYYKETVVNAACTKCPGTTPRTIPETGATAFASCGCDPGQYLLSGQCTDCPADKYKDAVGNQECTSCPAGGTTYGATGGNSTSDCICQPGYKTDATSICVTCGINFYSTANNSASCTACPVNERTSTPTASARSECICPSGFLFDDIFGTGQCYTAPPSFVAEGGNACIRCPEGQVTRNAGQTGTSNCESSSAVKSTRKAFLMQMRLPQLTYEEGMTMNKRGCTVFAIIYPQLIKLYQNTNKFIAIYPESTASGSVIAYYTLVTAADSTLTSQQAQDILNNGASTISLGSNSNFTIDPSNTKVLSVIDYPDAGTTSTTDDTDFKLIAIIVGSAVPGVILLGLLIACCWVVNKQKNVFKGKSSFRYDEMNGMNGGPPSYGEDPQAPWLNRNARWAPTYNGNMQSNGVYQQQGYGYPYANTVVAPTYKGGNWSPWQRGY